MGLQKQALQDTAPTSPAAMPLLPKGLVAWSLGACTASSISSPTTQGSVVHSGAPKMAYDKQNGERQGRQDRAAQGVKCQTQKERHSHSYQGGKDGSAAGLREACFKEGRKEP